MRPANYRDNIFCSGAVRSAGLIIKKAPVGTPALQPRLSH